MNIAAKTKKQVRIHDQREVIAPLPCVELPTDEDVCHQIDNLCSALQAPDPKTEVLGYLCEGQREYELRQVLDAVPLGNSYISLESLLLGQNGERLSRQQRFRLANIFASSLLQLQSTPWLARQIDERSVFFYRRGDQILLDHPYIKHEFAASNSDLTRPCNDACNPLMARNSLSNLGILLLELCFGETIETQEKLRRPYLNRDGNANDYTDFMTARDWAEFVDQEEPDLEQIVKSCVFCNFEMKANWDDKRFIQAVHASVVAPLEILYGKWSKS